jgi:hypothetical protein
MRIQASSGSGTSDVALDQRLESKDTAELAKPAWFGGGSSVSVFFKAVIINDSDAAIIPTLYLGTPASADNFTSVTVRNGGGSGSNLQSIGAYSNGAVTWSGTIGSYANLSNGLEVRLWLGSMNMDVTIVKVQMTVGTTDPGELFFPYFEELARCQRYFQAWYCASAGDYLVLGMGTAAANTMDVRVPLAVPMRATPTIACSATASDFRVNDGNNSANCSSVPVVQNFGNIGPTGWAVLRFSAGMTDYRPYYAQLNAVVGTYLYLSAEL